MAEMRCASLILSGVQARSVTPSHTWNERPLFAGVLLLVNLCYRSFKILWILDVGHLHSVKRTLEGPLEPPNDLVVNDIIGIMVGDGMITIGKKMRVIIFN